jgi:hypothetical protein
MKRNDILAILAAGAFIIGPAAAWAASPSQQQCEASGGTFTNDSGTKSCTSNVGNSDNSQTVTASGQGNLGNKPTCNGPGNSQSHC